MKNTSDALHPRPVQYKIVTHWKYGPQGLILHGPTGTGKTRACYMLLEWLIASGYTVKIIGAVDFQNEVIRRTKPGGSGDLDEYMAALLLVDILCIDDLDKMRFSQRVEAELYNLIDKRMGNELPLIISANSSGNDMARKMSDDTGPTIIRRIRECCTPVDFGPNIKPTNPPAAPD